MTGDSGAGRYSRVRPVLVSLVVLAFALVGTATLEAQSASLAGVVRSSGGDPLPRATVFITGERRIARSDDDGTFRLDSLAPGVREVHVRALGYRPGVYAVLLRAHETSRLEVALNVVPKVLAEVETRARVPERDRFDNVPNVGTVTISRAAFRAIPALGEADVLRTVQLMPGVVARNDYTAGFNVRGGEGDQNLVLLDGVPLYNPFHLGGLFSTFIDPSVQGLELMAGAFPAMYGGRLSSVLDVHTFEEGRPGLHGSGSVSLLSSTLQLSGALPRRGASITAAVRRTYADVVVERFTPYVFPYHFQDALMRGTLELPGGRGTLTGIVFAGLDEFGGSLGEGAEFGAGPAESRFGFDWGNRVAGIKWQRSGGVGGRGLFAHDSATLTQRISVTRFATTLTLGTSLFRFENRLLEPRAEGSFAWHRGARSWTAGYELARHNVRYESDALAQSAGLLNLRQSPSSVAAYLDHVWRPNPRWILRPGLRAEALSGSGWASLSPRLSAKFFLRPGVALTAAGGNHTQFMHAVRNEDFPIRIYDFWVASDRNTPVSSARHLVIGAEAWSGSDRFVRVEGFHKKYSRVLERSPLDDPGITGDEFRPTDGHSYGVDVTLRQLESRRVNGWIAYTYGVSTRRGNALTAPILAQPVSYAPPQDRRHNVNVVGAWRPTERSSIGARYGYGSGLPYTDVVGQLQRYEFDERTGTWQQRGGLDEEPVPGPRNGERFPGYHRLDFSLARTFHRGRVDITPSLHLLNAANRRNVFTYFFGYGQAPPTVQSIRQLPLLPTVVLQVEF